MNPLPRELALLAVLRKSDGDKASAQQGQKARFRWMQLCGDVQQSGDWDALMTNVLGLASEIYSHCVLATCQSRWHACLASWQPARRVVDPSLTCILASCQLCGATGFLYF